MADRRISELTDGGTARQGDVIAVVRDGSTSRAALPDLTHYVEPTIYEVPVAPVDYLQPHGTNDYYPRMARADLTAVYDKGFITLGTAPSGLTIESGSVMFGYALTIGGDLIANEADNPPLAANRQVVAPAGVSRLRIAGAFTYEEANARSHGILSYTNFFAVKVINPGSSETYSVLAAAGDMSMRSPRVTATNDTWEELTVDSTPSFANIDTRWFDVTPGDRIALMVVANTSNLTAFAQARDFTGSATATPQNTTFPGLNKLNFVFS